jgi:hypothetical protein
MLREGGECSQKGWKAVNWWELTSHHWQSALCHDLRIGKSWLALIKSALESQQWICNQLCLHMHLSYSLEYYSTISLFCRKGWSIDSVEHSTLRSVSLINFIVFAAVSFRISYLYLRLFRLLPSSTLNDVWLSKQLCGAVITVQSRPPDFIPRSFPKTWLCTSWIASSVFVLQHVFSCHIFILVIFLLVTIIQSNYYYYY